MGRLTGGGPLSQHVERYGFTVLAQCSQTFAVVGLEADTCSAKGAHGWPRCIVGYRLRNRARVSGGGPRRRSHAVHDGRKPGWIGRPDSLGAREPTVEPPATVLDLMTTVLSSAFSGKQQDVVVLTGGPVGRRRPGCLPTAWGRSHRSCLPRPDAAGRPTGRLVGERLEPPTTFDSAQSLDHMSDRSGGASASLRRGDGGRAGLEPPDSPTRLVRAGDAPLDGVSGEFPWHGAGRLSWNRPAVRLFGRTGPYRRTGCEGKSRRGSCGGSVVHGDCHNELPG